jgi:hypothetical protein
MFQTRSHGAIDGWFKGQGRTPYTICVEHNLGQDISCQNALIPLQHTHDEQPTEQLDAESTTHPPNQKSINIEPEPQCSAIPAPQIPRHHTMDVNRPGSRRHNRHNGLAHNRPSTASATGNTRRRHPHARPQHPHRLRVQSQGAARKVHSRSGELARR